MRNWILLTAAIGVLGTESISAQIPQNGSPTLQSRRSPHVDSLRRTLGLSPDVELRWATSTNSVDTFSVTDHFSRSSVGGSWEHDQQVWEIRDGELSLNANAIYEWRYLAVFTPVHNTPERKIHSVAYRWGRNADFIGIKEGAHAMMIDGPSIDGSGYWLWHRTNWFEVWLYIIKNGTWEYTVGNSKEVDRAPSQLPDNPVAGDMITAYVRNEPDAVYFDYYVNDILDATVKDASKEYAQNDTWYAGVFIHGQDLNNQVDDFTITWLEGDVVPPAGITDLHVTDSTPSSVRLEWTSTGDNGLDGRASRLELRYSTSPINAGNFSEATLAPNLPAPAPSGQKQNLNIQGLNSNTSYYFAVKVFDENGNSGPLSNVAQARTQSEGVAKQLAVIDGCGQTGEVNKDLPAQVAAKVADENGAAVSNSPVQFVVLSGDGTVGGQEEITVNTDAAGEAKATWKLGTAAGDQTVEIRAAGLEGSPHTCTALAKAAAPAKLNIIGGNRQVVSVGKTAPLPLIARLLDRYNNPHAGSSIVFNIVAGGGNFVSGQTNAGKIYQTLTDNDGYARTRVAVSDVYGDTTKITAKWTSGNGATSLLANFFAVAAPPDSVVEIKGNNQTATAGTALAESLVVKVLDSVDGAVENYAVTFRVLSGGGKVGNDQNEVQATTDDSGYARTNWILGSAAGVQQVEVNVAHNGQNLRNAPLIFKATATVPTGVEDQPVAVPQRFALHQNFPNPFNPETTISFDLPENGEVMMTLYDVTGRQIRQLLAAPMQAGSHRVIWNGADDSARPVDSGVYFLVLRARLGSAAREVTETRKVVLMK